MAGVVNRQAQSGHFSVGRAPTPKAPSRVTPTQKSYRCEICKKDKPFEQYSIKQQQSRLRAGHLGTCKSCAGPKLEMKCSDCRVVKSLNEFSKSQRRNNNHDNARCIPCQQRKDRIEPEDNFLNDPEDVSSASNDFEDDDDEDGEDGRTQGVSLNNASKSYGPQSTGKTGPSRAPAGWVQQPQAGTKGSGRPATTRQFHPNAYGRPKYGATSATSAQAGDKPTTNRYGWAKIPKTGQEPGINLAVDGDTDSEKEDEEEPDGWSPKQHKSSDDDESD